jgi:hypothetical protein
MTDGDAATCSTGLRSAAEWSFWVISDRNLPGHPLAVSDAVARLAHALRVKDVLVLERRGALLRLRGGFGRGASWAGTGEIDAGAEPLVKQATPNQPPVRVTAGVPRHIIGPYWSRHAAVVAVGPDQLVVVGSDEPIRVGWATPDAEDEDLATAQRTADERMYRAKREASV